MCVCIEMDKSVLSVCFFYISLDTNNGQFKGPYPSNVYFDRYFQFLDFAIIWEDG